MNGWASETMSGLGMTDNRPFEINEVGFETTDELILSSELDLAFALTYELDNPSFVANTYLNLWLCV